MLGRIFLVKSSVVTKKTAVLNDWQKTIILRDEAPEVKGWTFDVLKCIDRIESSEFSLGEVYGFEKELKSKHAENNFIRDKIRQQLQILRDRNIIEFVSRGKYRKVSR